MNKKSNKVKSKIANYSLVAAGALTMLTACKKEDDNNPDINDVDVDPDISVTAPTNSGATANIDFNNDGIVDVVAYSYAYDYGASDNINYGYFGTNSGSEFLVTEEQVTIGTGSYAVDLARGLSEGTPVSGTQMTWADEAMLGVKGTYSGVPVSAGQFLGSDKYVGVRFSAAGNTHYGWMLVGMTANGSSVTVKEYAYHETANTSIGAGEK